MDSIARRDMFKLAGMAGLAAVVPAEAEAASAPVGPAPPSYHFLNDLEAAFLAAAVDHLIPPDDRWPGAADAGVVTYIDRQLAGSYGAGDRLYLEGPWKDGTPEQGYQLPYSPAELYRAAMTGLSRHLEGKYAGRRFEQLNRSEQESLLRAMEAGELDLGDVPSAVFFETLLANTIEGYFADPMYGGNRDMAAWRMIGFPGAYANYVSLVDLHGIKYDQPPLSAAQAAHSHGHGR